MSEHIKTGSCALVFDGNSVSGNVLVINCAKGRGYTLPGGKWEPGETFADTALRELKEETGLIGKLISPVYAGVNVDGYYGRVYRITVDDYSTMAPTAEGVPELKPWDCLMSSTMWPFYEDMFASIINGSNPGAIMPLNIGVEFVDYYLKKYR